MPHKKRLVSIAVLAISTIGGIACGQGTRSPAEADGRRAVEEQLTRLGPAVRLAKFVKTDGKELSPLDYWMEYQCEIEFTADTRWDWFTPLQPPVYPALSGKASRGERHPVTGEIILSKTERGWRVVRISANGKDPGKP